MLSRRVDSTFVHLRRSYHQLQLTVRRLEVARALSRQTFVVGASPDARKVQLQLRPTPDFAEVPRLRGGAVEMFTEPVSPLVCEIAAGVAWVERPQTYAVDGGVVVESAGSGQRTSVLLGLRVAAPGVPVFGLMGSLGLGAEKRPIVSVGGSLRLFPLVRIDGGVAWQSEERLPPGWDS